MTKLFRIPEVKCTLLICLCFLLTSTGWLSWEYHLMEQTSTAISDICTMVIGYLLQAGGIGLFAIIRRPGRFARRHLLGVALILHMVLMLPSVISPVLGVTLVFGLLMNLVCGVIAGAYLEELAEGIVVTRRGTVFGLGYGLATLASWLLSLTGSSLYYSERVLLVALVLTVLCLLMAGMSSGEASESGTIVTYPVAARSLTKTASEKHVISGSELIWLCILVSLLSMVNSLGFAFPSADLSSSIKVEFTRLVYGIGLILAGIVSDKKR